MTYDHPVPSSTFLTQRYGVRQFARYGSEQTSVSVLAQVSKDAEDSGLQQDALFQKWRGRMRSALAPVSILAKQVNSLVGDQLADSEESLDIDCLDAQLKLNGFNTTKYTNYGGQERLWNQLSHTFIIVYKDWPSPQNEMVIVDPNFASQFYIAKPTSRYNTVLTLVPSVVVGTPQQIINVVTHLSKEMSLAFKERGYSTPPWRSLSSLQSKWKIQTLQRSTSEPAQRVRVSHVGPFDLRTESNNVRVRNANQEELGGYIVLDQLGQFQRLKSSPLHKTGFDDAFRKDQNIGAFVVQKTNTTISGANPNPSNILEFGEQGRRSSLPSASSELSALLRDATTKTTTTTTVVAPNMNCMKAILVRDEQIDIRNSNKQNQFRQETNRAAYAIRGELFKAIEAKNSSQVSSRTSVLR
eukprot:TRINITY_DN5090_c1_g1_i1.p2 TRINITY_DN5090_c1_g1~~TRINITY_DN5090_c1_g1_i1.p2  ORF type:complete len:413 (-),score=41.08 TRINITY_DN5090_c1_g1_i1:1363-2601(-)